MLHTQLMPIGAGWLRLSLPCSHMSKIADTLHVAIQILHMFVLPSSHVSCIILASGGLSCQTTEQGQCAMQQ